jgi:hypothetical protein
MKNERDCSDPSNPTITKYTKTELMLTIGKKNPPWNFESDSDVLFHGWFPWRG